MLVEPSTRRPASAHVVVLGNEKGGSGKSTTAMHVAVALLNAGQRVATIDLDSRQKSFTHYIENRRRWASACRHRAQGADAFLRRRAARRSSSTRTRRSEFAGFAEAIGAVEQYARFRRRRHARHRQLSDAARAFDGRHADYAAQRQLRRFRCARHRRPDHLCGDRREPLRRDGARRAPAAPPGRRHAHRLDRRAQPASMLGSRNKRLVGEGLAELGQRLGFRCADGLAERVSTASSSRAGSLRSTASTRPRSAPARACPMSPRARRS